MKRSLYFLIAGLILTVSAGCKKINGKGDTLTETRTATNYQAISLSMSGTVTFRQDSVYSLRVTAQENLLPYIETNVEDNRLVIKIKNNYTLGSHDPITINITAPSVNKLDISGSGNMNIAKGTATASTLVISGSGTIQARNFMANSVNATISGSGDIYCWATELLLATISGSGNIYYNGNPQVELHVSGSGHVGKL